MIADGLERSGDAWRRIWGNGSSVKLSGVLHWSQLCPERLTKAFLLPEPLTKTTGGERFELPGEITPIMQNIMRNQSRRNDKIRLSRCAMLFGVAFGATPTRLSGLEVLGLSRRAGCGVEE